MSESQLTTKTLQKHKHNKPDSHLAHHSLIPNELF